MYFLSKDTFLNIFYAKIHSFIHTVVCGLSQEPYLKVWRNTMETCDPICMYVKIQNLQISEYLQIQNLQTIYCREAGRTSCKSLESCLPWRIHSSVRRSVWGSYELS